MQCVCRAKTETELSCTRCATPICPSCFVPGAVGTLCKKCADLNGSPLFKIAPERVALMLFVGVIAGFVAGSLLQRIGYYGIFGAFFAGGAIGEGLYICSGRKSGPKVKMLALGSLLGGGTLSLIYSGAYLSYLNDLTGALLFFVGLSVVIFGAFSRLR
jgi:hypothetical protein